ncbi:hypothetical protein K0U07_00065 [bacterium]|nr:hypothetical protein [bacterium]
MDTAQAQQDSRPPVVVYQIVGSTDSHVGAVTRTATEAAGKFEVIPFGSYQGCGAKQDEAAYGKFDLCRTVGEKNIAWLARQRVVAVHLVNAIGFIPTVKTVRSIHCDAQIQKAFGKAVHGPMNVALDTRVMGCVEGILRTATAEQSEAGAAALRQLRFLQFMHAQGHALLRTCVPESCDAQVWVGIKRVPPKASEGDWAGNFAREHNCLVYDFGGNRAQSYNKDGTKRTKMDKIRTNDLFADGQYYGLTEDYKDAILEEFARDGMPAADKRILKFTGKARNAKSQKFLNNLQAFLVANGYVDVELSFLPLGREGQLEAEMMQVFMNKGPSKMGELFKQVAGEAAHAAASGGGGGGAKAVAEEADVDAAAAGGGGEGAPALPAAAAADSEDEEDEGLPRLGRQNTTDSTDSDGSTH